MIDQSARITNTVNVMPSQDPCSACGKPEWKHEDPERYGTCQSFVPKNQMSLFDSLHVTTAGLTRS